MIRPDVADIPAEAARFFLALDFSDADQARIAELSAQARGGTLTVEGRMELDNYIRLSDFLALIESKSRRSLRQQARSGGLMEKTLDLEVRRRAGQRCEYCRIPQALYPVLCLAAKKCGGVIVGRLQGLYDFNYANDLTAGTLQR